MGRFFALFDHPVERAVRVFEHLKATDPEVGFMNLMQYAASTKIENNYLTRKLSNHPSGELTEDHIKVALEVIRRKFLVGLGKHIDASFTRFEQYFRWTYKVNPVHQEQCRSGLVENQTQVEMPVDATLKVPSKFNRMINSNESISCATFFRLTTYNCLRAQCVWAGW